MTTPDASTRVPWASHRRRRPAVVAAVLAAVFLGTLGNVPAAHARSASPAPTACPPDLADKARCYSGQDANGAHYTMAVPTDWNGSLVVHAHGGPDLGDSSDPSRSTDDLERWAVMVDEGYAWPAPPTAAAATEPGWRPPTRRTSAACSPSGSAGRSGPTSTDSPGAATSPPRSRRPTAGGPAPTTEFC